MYIVSQEIVAEPMAKYSARHHDSVSKCAGGLRIAIRAHLRCPVCKKTTSEPIQTYWLNIAANNGAIVFEVTTNLSWLVKILCDGVRSCSTCGVASKVPQADSAALTEWITTLVTTAWVEQELAKHGISSDNEIVTSSY